MIDIDSFIADQLSRWPMAAANFDALNRVETRSIAMPDGSEVKVQFNPARIASSGAKVDAASLKKRPCFLCESNRPAEQYGLPWRGYTILINPFPIFPRHLTIPTVEHTPQRIAGRIADMIELAKELPSHTIFYNGPRCGASAPDHCHFQAVPREYLRPQGIEVRSVEAFDELYRQLPIEPGDNEPMMNILCTWEADGPSIVVVPRKRHRPSFYGSELPEQMLVSPASIDLSGVIITPLKKDFDRMDADIVGRLYDELCYTPEELSLITKISKTDLPMETPTINVGILTADKIEFTLHGAYTLDGEPVSGKVSISGGHLQGELKFVPQDDTCYAEVHNVKIGIDFHWERVEDQCFPGVIKIRPDDHFGSMILINSLPVETYLESVISSEMSATSDMELLKAHAVISRSWVLAQLAHKSGNTEPAFVMTDDEIVRWYDHQTHFHFDVCADDHCQRYQGTTRQSSPNAKAAVSQTAGEVLMSQGELCDARFSKCCGGVFEQFENCWEPEPKPYLVARRDREQSTPVPDLTLEDNARQWIMSKPEAFCNTTDTAVLGQVLNGYDQETPDFYRWTVEYTADELAELVERKSGLGFGKIIDLQTVERGTSGRIVRLRIVGENRTMIIGKELEIRRLLSPSHLYSSAFVAERTADGGFRLHGAGWGHGVGLCQIGAAIMAHNGYDYRSILAHYFPGSEIEKRY